MRAASGWNDPNLTVQNVRAFADQYCDVEYDWRDVDHDQPNLPVTLYRLRGPQRLSQAENPMSSLSPFGFDHRDRITGLGTPRSDGFLGGMRPLATS